MLSRAAERRERAMRRLLDEIAGWPIERQPDGSATLILKEQEYAKVAKQLDLPVKPRVAGRKSRRK